MGDSSRVGIHMKDAPQHVIMHADEALPGSPMRPFPFYGNDTIPDVIRRYENMYPAEAKMYSEDAARNRKALCGGNGMSEEGTCMMIGKIPPFLYLSMQAFDINFWSVPKNTHAFFEACPGLRVAPHRATGRAKVGAA